MLTYFAIYLLAFAQNETQNTTEELVNACAAQANKVEAAIAAGEITGLDAIDAWADVAWSWEQCAQREDAPSEVWVQWSESLLNANNASNANRIIENGIEIFPKDSKLLEQKARILMSQARESQQLGNQEKYSTLKQEAITTLEIAHENNPKAASPLLRLGEISWTDYFAKKDFSDKAKSEALAPWLKAAAVDPEGVDSGFVYNWLQSESIPVLNLIIEKDEKNAFHFWYRGMAYYFKGPDFWSNIYEDFNKVLELNPNFKNAYFYLADGAFQRGVMQAGLGEDSKAKKAYNFSAKYYGLYLKDFGSSHAAVHIQANSLRQECERMNFLASFTDYEHAIMILEWATQNDDSYLDVWNNLAFLYREVGEIEGSLAAYQHALSIAPNDPQIMNDLAVIYHYYLKTNDEEALKLYEQAIIRAEEILANEAKGNEDLSLVRIALRDARNNLAKLKKGNRRNG